MTARGLVTVLFGLLAFLVLGALALLYATDVGASVLLAVITAVTPAAGI
jgi:hypothetical protein